MAFEARYADLEADVACCLNRSRRFAVRKKHLSEDFRSEERTVLVLPEVAEDDVTRLALKEMRHRLATEDIAILVHDNIDIRDVLVDITERELCSPFGRAMALKVKLQR